MLRVSYSLARCNTSLINSLPMQLETKPQLPVEGQIETEKKIAEPTKEKEILPSSTGQVIALEESKKEAEDMADADFDGFLVANQGLQLVYINSLNPEHPKHSGPRNEIASYTQVTQKLNQIVVRDKDYMVKPVVCHG